jgi:hypothetical protein
MKDLKFICVQPDDSYYTWQVNLWLESLRSIGHSDKAEVLIFTPLHRKRNEKWNQIVDLYPESKFFFYNDVDNITNLIKLYIPIIRPYTLIKHFKAHPYLKECAIFYCDSDILFTEKFDVSKFLNDEVNYLSNTNAYINASYFDSKIKDVLPEKLDEYKQIDVLSECLSLLQLNRKIAEEKNNDSGGAQYLLKNIDEKFWIDVLSACINIRIHLMKINKYYFENEAKGFQSWCADMWAVLWTLWKNNTETKVVKELDFAWATDQITKLNDCTIFHNAGVSGDVMNDVPMFYKGKYHNGLDPTKDEHLFSVLENEKSKKLCTHYYVTKLLELKNKYDLNY